MTAALALIALSLPSMAVEGMWLPEQLPSRSAQLAELGLELDPQTLSDPLAAPLSSIVSLGFCSASFVSPDGLIVTNHHCVQGYLQHNATGEANIVETGFTAASHGEELPGGPQARLYVVERIEDVTERVMAGVGKRTKDLDRYKKVERVRSEIVAECEAQENRRCRVAQFHGGLEYRLMVQRVIKDVRVVHSPPRSVGEFGGEVDNWMWPRHTGDFSMLRAYVAPDGSSANQSDENVPYKPSSWLKIDPTGAQSDEFVMVVGFPGSTDRHRRAVVMQHYAEGQYAKNIALIDQMLAVLERHSAADPDAAAKLAAPIGYVSNYRKYAQGMLDGFEASDVVGMKQAREAEFQNWVMLDRVRTRTYAPAIAELDALEQTRLNRERGSEALRWLTYASDLGGVATRAVRWAVEQDKPDLERASGYQDRDRERTLQRFDAMDQTLVLAADRDLTALMLANLVALPAESRIAPVADWVESLGGVDAAMDKLYGSPSLADGAARRALLDMDLATLKSSEDPWVQLGVAIEQYNGAQREQVEAESGGMRRLQSKVMQGWLEWKEGQEYPDANSTLRVSYGTVQGYKPQDAVWYEPHSTLAGTVAKRGDNPFDLPQQVVDRAADAHQSRWADPLAKDVVVNFLADLDTTGGNSGSATLNGKGELVGLIFDGNYEAIAADWLFMPELTRSIHVDVRYMLWLLEADAKAGWLMEELGQAAAE